MINHIRKMLTELLHGWAIKICPADYYSSVDEAVFEAFKEGAREAISKMQNPTNGYITSRCHKCGFVVSQRCQCELKI